MMQKLSCGYGEFPELQVLELPYVGEALSMLVLLPRKVNGLASLEAQVRRCEHNLGLKWFDDDITDMAAYLNTHYYKFKP